MFAVIAVFRLLPACNDRDFPVRRAHNPSDNRSARRATFPQKRQHLVAVIALHFHDAVLHRAVARRLPPRTVLPGGGIVPSLIAATDGLVPAIALPIFLAELSV